MSKTSPLPWNLEDRDGGDPKLTDADGEFVTLLSASRYYDNSKKDPVAAANADFIVRACNAHEEMVEALRAITDTLLVSSVCPFGLAYLKRSPIDKSFDTTCSCNFHEAARLAVAALAKAEGR